MEENKKKYIKISAIALTLLFVIFSVIAGMVALPQLREKGKRYMQTTEFKNRTQSVQLIAHRGLSGLAFENTVQAFEEAGKRTYYGIETDVRITKDGKFIIVHDNDLNELLGLDIKVEESNFDELRALRFGDKRGELTDGDLYFPSLGEYFAVCKKYEKQAILEMKSDFTAEQVAELVGIVTENGWLENTTFISFSRENLIYLRGLYPTQSAQYLVQTCKAEDIEFMLKNKLDGNFHWTAVTKSRVEKLHSAGLKVNCWTVDGAACATLMQDYGVDQITTNVLE